MLDSIKFGVMSVSAFGIFTVILYSLNTRMLVLSEHLPIEVFTFSPDLSNAQPHGNRLPGD